MTRLPDDFQGLTDAGWPRPWLRHRVARKDGNHEDVLRPVAWATPAPRFAEIEPRRAELTEPPWVCQVCGETHGDDDPVVIFLDGGLRDRAGEPVGLRSGNQQVDFGFHRDRLTLKAIDAAVLHERCAALTAHHCPRMREKRQAGELFAFVGPAKAVKRHEGGTLRWLYMDGGQAMPWRLPGR